MKELERVSTSIPAAPVEGLEEEHLTSFSRSCRREELAARWRIGLVNVVYGQLGFAFYYLLQGHMGAEKFVQTKAGLECVNNRVLKPRDFFSMSDASGTLDNGVHRITVLEESLSVHVYPDGTFKGKCFPDYQHPSPFLTGPHDLEKAAVTSVTEEIC